ncbi:hypothetical protein [Butyrivibrio sp. WCD3002]|uniref:hypothetical protein n=1 Tax=Butyrivibrio sp. WCD3002 TaxID=1280676 RepID=UPI0004018E04|nr:hypothetical protein [Butyrivibrio sp. WCD3002]
MEIIEERIIVETLIRVAVLLIMLISAFEDMRSRKIDIIYPLACALISVIWSFYSIIYLKEGIFTMALSLLPGAIMLALSCVLKTGLGIGDGLMVIAAGPVFGSELAFAGITMAFVFSAIGSIFLLISGKASLKSKMAFLPYLTAGMGVISFAFI